MSPKIARKPFLYGIKRVGFNQQVFFEKVLSAVAARVSFKVRKNHCFYNN